MKRYKNYWKKYNQSTRSNVYFTAHWFVNESEKKKLKTAGNLRQSLISNKSTLCTWVIKLLQMLFWAPRIIMPQPKSCSNGKKSQACCATPYIYRLPSISIHCPSICEISSHLSSTTVCCCCGKRMLHANSSDLESVNIWWWYLR